MERMMVKSEENIENRYMCLAESQVQAVRGVKRRRREPAAVTVRTDEDLSQHQQQQQQQTDKTSATTVKRSSRFRGVSRSRRLYTILAMSN